MTDDMEDLLRQFRPVGPPAHLGERVLDLESTPALSVRRWPLLCFRSAIAAMLLLSFALFYAAGRLNQESAACVGLGPPRWTAEAQRATDLMGGDPVSRQYIAMCLVAANNRSSRNLSLQGVNQ